MLTKSSFLAYRHCPKSFWLAARRPELIASAPTSLFMRKILADGYEVERAFGELVARWPDAGAFSAQISFDAPDLLARADFVRTNPDASIDFFEVKGSSSVKEYHVVDATFQMLVAERAGRRVGDVHVVHLNKEYVRRGDLDLQALLCVEDITELVAASRDGIAGEIDAALALLASDAIDEDGCDCIYFGNPENRCAGFDHFNKGIPDLSIYLLPRLLAQRTKAFVDGGRLALADITSDELSPLQRPVHRAAVEGAPVINHDAIRGFLAKITWPIHFYDYETCNPPIPQADGYRPSQQAVVQYSLHVLHEDGRLNHHEWLSDGHGEERALVEDLKARVGPAGSAIVWNEAFERTCNRELGALLVDDVGFFSDLNARTIDLMVPFKADYVDIAFGGSTSIKRVLPVVCPDLQYDPDGVHDGGGAMEAWGRMVSSEDADEKARLRAELLAYCGVDTLAMVEIYRFLVRVTAI